MKVKACLYSRVSTNSEAQELSYKLQQKYHNDNLDIIERYNDKGKTGTNINRPAFKQMLLDAGIKIKIDEDGDISFKIVGDPKFSIIVVANSARFMRNSLLHKQIIEKLHQNNVSIFYSDISRTSNEENIGLILDILFSLDQAYSEQLSGKVNNGLERARENGRFVVTKLFGYKYIPKVNKLIVNEEEAEIVRNLFNDYIAGEGTTLLSKRYGFGKSTLVRMLQNEKYTSRAYGELNSNIERIISDEIFEQAQKCRIERTSNENKGKKYSKHPISAKIKCSKCGGNYISIRNKYLTCNTKNSKGKDLCDSVNIKLDDVFLDIKTYLIVLPSWISRAFRNVKARYSRIDLSDLEKDIRLLEDKLERLTDLYTDGDISKDKYRSKKEDVVVRLTVLQEKHFNLSDINNHLYRLDALELEYGDLIRSWKNLSYNGLFDKLLSADARTVFYEEEGRSYVVLSNFKFKELLPLYEMLEKELLNEEV